MNNIKKSLILLPIFALLIAGCTPSEDVPEVKEEDTTSECEGDECTLTDGEKGSDDGSGDTSGSGPVTTYDAAYALVGDFTDSSWNEYPDDDSIYYLPYSTSDKSTMYWERTVTIESTTQSWLAGFRVVKYGSWDTVVGYSNLTVDSAGVISSDGEDNIKVTWGETYNLVIDCTGTSNKIKVTLVEEEEEEIVVNIDSYYVIVGNLSDASWEISPGYDSDYTLPYDSTLANSKYWQRTITTSAAVSGTDNPGFRICKYGDSSWTTVAGYSDFSIDSASNAVYGYDQDNNVKVENWNTSYDVTIDMRSSTWTIKVDAHVDGFEKVDGNYTSSGGSSSGGSSSGGSSSGVLWGGTVEEPGAYVDKIDNLDNDYIMGVDISSIEEVLNAGGVFYDLSGNKIDSLDGFMKLLYDSGVNYVRIRLWNDPTDSSGNSYGGGGNDLDTDLKIAGAASSAGLKICLDLHYSDFWAHHGQQWAPKTWKSLGTSGNNTRASTAAAWTSEVLTAFSNVNATPSMVQVGNETNNNWISGYEGDSNAVNFFKECCSAVRSFSNDIKIVIHYADDQNANSYINSYNSLVSGGVDFDVCGLSFYPFWHENGSLASFKSTLQSVKNGVSGKDVCLMEYSYGWTTDWTNWGTTYGNMSNTFNDSLVLSDYPATPQGQASCIRDINEVVSEVGGLGSFYWEPAWLSKPDTSWAFSASSSYYNDNGTSTSDYVFGTNTWANQALFDYNGYALQSLNVFNQMRNGVDYSSEKYVSGDLNVTGQVDTGGDRASQLPSSVAVYTSFDRTVYCDITWNSESLTALNSASDGSTITMSGTITIGGETLTITGIITLYHEYVVNGSFEEGTTDNVQTATGWSFKGSCGKPRSKDAAHTGNFYYDCWYGNDFTCGVYQTIDNVPAGTYTLEVYYLLQNTTSLEMKLYATIGEDTSSVTLDQGVVGSYVYQSVTFTINAESSVTIGMDAVGAAGACANLDDFSMYAIAA